MEEFFAYLIIGTATGRIIAGCLLILIGIIPWLAIEGASRFWLLFVIFIAGGLLLIGFTILGIVRKKSQDQVQAQTPLPPPPKR